jgi:biopolymer transport protein ExbD
MSFYVKKRSLPIIPVISLIDIMTVLLIFFVVTTTFKKKTSTGALKITLPSSQQMKIAPEQTTRTAVSVDAASEITVGTQATTIENLSATLLQLKQAQPQLKLELKADEKVPLGTLVKIWDALAAAGYQINSDVPTKILLTPAKP